MLPTLVRTAAATVLLAFVLLLTGCETDRPAITRFNANLRAPVFDAAFRKIWDDGSAEVATYTTERQRGGARRRGTATSITQRTVYSEDERVPVSGTKRQQTDQFSAIQMNWVERFSEGIEPCQEMTTAALALSSVDGRSPGVATKVDFSLQSWDGQLFHQLLFDATGVRSHQYSYYESEGDEQITLAYPGEGVSDDALWLWARHMGAPALQRGEERTVLLLPALRDARSQHFPLSWKRAVLARARELKVMDGKSVDGMVVRRDDGTTETFLVQAEMPFHVLRWESSAGERAQFVSADRVKSWETSRASNSVRQ